MAKHHKKPNPLQASKLLTAQNRKLFFERFRNLLKLLTGNDDLYLSIPEPILEYLYNRRMLALQVEAAAGSIIDKQTLKFIKELIQQFFHDSTCEVGKNGETITISEYASVGTTFLKCDILLKDKAFENADKLIALSKLFEEKQDSPNSGWIKMNNSIRSAVLIVSKMNDSLYWATVDSEVVMSNGEYHVCYKALINRYIQNKIAITIDGNTRPAVRVGWADFDGVTWCEREASLFGLPESHANLPVYIQMHAINRMEERLDGTNTNFLHWLLSYSAKNGAILKGANNQYLIEYKYLNWKAGYLSVVVHNGMLVIRTFLFLTNNGTPEGKKLQELAGLQKRDKEYLALDKLSTFINSDLRNNEAMRRLFIEAGCGDLLELAQEQIYGKEEEINRVNVKTMMDYLMLKSQDADAIPDFSDALGNTRYS
ncbi:MAG: hypothetical protein WC780_06230 [Lentimicrobiaceae bacterium]|jgi:hypothetical protein